jgi:hypothetical protein
MKTRHTILCGFLAVIIALAFTACSSEYTTSYGTDPGGGYYNPNPYPPTHTHQWSDWAITTYPNCRENGVKTRYCYLDSSHEEIELIDIDPTAHIWQMSEITYYPTCTETGEGIRRCDRCGENLYTTIPATGHNYQWTTTTYPTATTDGIEMGTCVNYNCGETTTRTIPATGGGGHTHQGSWTAITPATITEDGVEGRTCATCGETETRIAYATGSPGLMFILINGNTGYSVFKDPDPNSTEISGELYIPAYRFYEGYQFIDGNYQPVSVYLPITAIGNSAFFRCDITGVSIPASVATIGNNAFTQCTSLTSIEIPAGVMSIGQGAFMLCSNLETITFAQNSQLTTIGINTFRDCNSLTNITLPEGLTSIGDAAFVNCTSLASIGIPASVTSIGKQAFYSSSSTPMSLTTVTFAPGSRLETIGDHAFQICNRLTSITIPASVTTIGNAAFTMAALNNSLTTVIFAPGSRLEIIGDYAFSGCTSLANITLPAGVTSVGSLAFQYWGIDQTQTINIQGSTTGWDSNWRGDCFANINY